MNPDWCISIETYDLLRRLRLRLPFSTTFLLYEDLVILLQDGLDCLSVQPMISSMMITSEKTDLALKTHMFQVQPAFMCRCTQQCRAKDDRKIRDRHLIDRVFPPYPSQGQSASVESPNNSALTDEDVP